MFYNVKEDILKFFSFGKYYNGLPDMLTKQRGTILLTDWWASIEHDFLKHVAEFHYLEHVEYKKMTRFELFYVHFISEAGPDLF